MTDDDKLALFAAACYHALLTDEMRHSEGQFRLNRRPGWHESIAPQAWQMARALLEAQPPKAADSGP